MSHMFMHDSLTSFRQMLPLITINRSLRCSSWMRFIDQIRWVCLNTRFYCTAHVGDDWAKQEGWRREPGFTSVWIPAVLMRWSCLQPAHPVRAPTAMCALLGFTCSGRRCSKKKKKKTQQRLDSTCSFSHKCMLVHIQYWIFFLQSSQVIGHDSPKALSHTHFTPEQTTNIWPSYFVLFFMLYIPVTSLGVCGRKWAAW